MSTGTQVKGYDSAAHTRREDYLNRWPLAEEIYGIATTGPEEWSVRIGLYGEWGSGKTSVLNFVGDIARDKKQVVVPFNPWEYGSRNEMWRNFVLSVLKAIEKELGVDGFARKAKAKDWGAKLATVVGKLAGSVVGSVSDKGGETIEGGIELLKGYLGFGENDFKDLRATLGTRRVIVLIDDLDRTSPRLVPEILFALKELMDIPGFSFVCAFDPVEAIGDVLGNILSFCCL